MDKTMELTGNERKSMSYSYGERKKCAECHKEFYVAKWNQGNYRYKRNGRFYCSWSCYRKKGKKK